jgi:16S rRNA (guanine527-N7)-methyltransferase
MTPLSRAEAGALLGCDAEELERLDAYLALLAKWNPKINLVGPATLADPWRRHIADLGSGAGLPGLILAILGANDVHLVESDQRKCAFLREAARICATKVTIHAARIEAVPALAADVVTARALASLTELLPWAARHLAPGGTCLFLKGARIAEELTAAQDCWNMETEYSPSLADPSGAILKILLPAPGAARTT